MPSLLLWRTWCYVPSSAIYTWLYLPLHLPWMRPYFILPRKRQKHCFVLQGQCISFTRKPFSARLWEPQLFKLLSVKRKSEELSLFSTALSSWGKSLNHTVRSQTCTGFDCVRSHFSYSVATSQCTWVHSIWNDFERVLWRQCRPCLQDKEWGWLCGSRQEGLTSSGADRVTVGELRLRGRRICGSLRWLLLLVPGPTIPSSASCARGKSCHKCHKHCPR